MSAPDLATTIDNALAVAQGELTRIQQDAAAKTAQAQAQVDALTQAKAAVAANPNLQLLVNGLVAAGFKISFG